MEAPEYTLVPADATPHPAPNKAGFVLQASARLVDVGFVAYEKKGHPLTNLTQNEIELFDNGKKQSIQLFYQAAPAINPPSGSPSRPPSSCEYFHRYIHQPGGECAGSQRPTGSRAVFYGSAAGWR